MCYDVRFVAAFEKGPRILFVLCAFCCAQACLVRGRVLAHFYYMHWVGADRKN